MKFFKCPNCDNFSREADATVALRVRIVLHQDQSWSAANEGSDAPYHEKIEELDLSSALCIMCEKSPLELVEVEQCPHETDESYWNYYGTTRRCRLCGEEQKAKTVVFE